MATSDRLPVNRKYILVTLFAATSIIGFLVGFPESSEGLGLVGIWVFIVLSFFIKSDGSSILRSRSQQFDRSVGRYEIGLQYLRMGLRQLAATFEAERQQRGGESFRIDRTIRYDADGRPGRSDGQSGARVEDVMVERAVAHEGPFVGAARHDASAIELYRAQTARTLR